MTLPIYTVSVTGGAGDAGDEEVTVTWSTEESNATSNDDFSPTSGTLTLSVGKK